MSKLLLTSGYELEQLGPALYLLPKKKGMAVPGLIAATEQLLSKGDLGEAIKQVENVAHLPGIVGYSIAMPDMHWGYGFPIGGVAATDAETGIISPGGVGYDINCGVRLALLPPDFSLDAKREEKLLHALFHHIPSGVGCGVERSNALSDHDYNQLLVKGSRWSIEKGFGFSEDMEFCESRGVIAGANYDAPSLHAKERGRNQLGSIGSGNHFVEVGKVQHIFFPQIAEAWGIRQGQVYVLIHTGSRGFGHQVCQETLDKFLRLGLAKELPDRQLVSAKILSPEGQHYIQAMAAAANFAFNNRQHVLHKVRRSFQDACGVPPEQVRLLYDVCHNIAKFEMHKVDGKMRKLCVHRKGATRAFGSGAEELHPLYKDTGQPVLVPGDMGRASHIMVGMGCAMSWCSSCHGAGREHSRSQSTRNWQGRDLLEYMRKQGVRVMAHSKKTIAEEMPDAYKDVDEVVEAVELAGFAKQVARLTPRLVLKG